MQAIGQAASSGLAVQLKAQYTKLKEQGLVPRQAPQQKFQCSVCRDAGYIEQKLPDGSMTMIPCKCLAKRGIESMLKKSGISADDYNRYRLENFKTESKEQREMKELAGKYIECRRTSQQGIGYFGKSGSGKTHLCIAICRALTDLYGQSHTYFNYRREIQKIKSFMYEDGKYEKAVSYWSSVDNLYIDDLFKFAERDNGKFQQQDMQIMFDIINTRYLTRKSTLISSEYSNKQIINLVDEALGSRIYAMVEPYGYYVPADNNKANARMAVSSE